MDKEVKAAVFYFTGTGNNLRIAKGLQENLQNTDIFPFHRLKKMKQIDEKYTHIIFSVPTYYSHIPPFVKECMRGLTFTPEQKVITIAGCGGNRGMTVEDMRVCVNACGKEVLGEYMVMMPGNYIIGYDAFPQFYQKMVSALAEKKIKKIAKAIKKDRLSVLKKPGMFYKKKSEPDMQETIASFSDIGKNYTVSDACVGCGICEKVCPAGNIRVENKKPVFGENCQQCVACVQWCPKQAIDYENKAKDRTRYHHRAITVNDIITGNKND